MRLLGILERMETEKSARSEAKWLQGVWKTQHQQIKQKQKLISKKSIQMYSLDEEGIRTKTASKQNLIYLKRRVWGSQSSEKAS